MLLCVAKWGRDLYLLLFRDIFHPTYFFLLDIHFLITNCNYIIVFLNIIVLISPYFFSVLQIWFLSKSLCSPKTFILWLPSKIYFIIVFLYVINMLKTIHFSSSIWIIALLWHARLIESPFVFVNLIASLAICHSGTQYTEVPLYSVFIYSSVQVYS